MSHHEPSDNELQALTSKIMELVSKAPDGPDCQVETSQILQAASTHGALDAVMALDLALQRSKGVPLPLMVGQTTFMGLEMICRPGVLVAREETELLGWTAVSKLREYALSAGKPLGDLRVIDVGSGSGNLTCGIAKNLPDARLWALDIDPACTSLTQMNVEKHELADRVETGTGDMFAPLADRGLEGTIDAVICNPPYISSVRLQKDRAYLLDNEPKAAFDGGPFGISIQMRLAKESIPFLRPGGWLLFEFGTGQDRQVKQLIERAGGYDITDFAWNQNGEPRVSINRKRSEGL